MKTEDAGGEVRLDDRLGVAQDLIGCCRAWEPEARVLGNIRAGDAAGALGKLLKEREVYRNALDDITQRRVLGGAFVRVFAKGILDMNFDA